MIRDARQEGAVLTELVVAVSLTILVGAVTMAAVVGPLVRLQQELALDAHRIQVETAADVVARVLRAARPGLDGPALREVSAHGLSVSVGGPDSTATVHIASSGAALLLTRSGTPGDAPDVPEGVLLEPLDPDGIAIRFIGADGHVLAPGSTDPVGVILTLASQGVVTTRVVRLRDQETHVVLPGW